MARGNLVAVFLLLQTLSEIGAAGGVLEVDSLYQPAFSMMHSTASCEILLSVVLTLESGSLSYSVS